MVDVANVNMITVGIAIFTFTIRYILVLGALSSRCDPLCFRVVQYINRIRSSMNLVLTWLLQSGEDAGGAHAECQYQLKEMTVTRTMMMIMHNTNIDFAHVAYTADSAEKDIQLKSREFEDLILMTCRVIYNSGQLVPQHLEEQEKLTFRSDNKTTSFRCASVNSLDNINHLSRQLL